MSFKETDFFKNYLNTMYGTEVMKNAIVVLVLPPKRFVEIIEERISEDISPFIKVHFDTTEGCKGVYYHVYAKFFYKGVFYQCCCSTDRLDTYTVAKVCQELMNEIRMCMEERD